MVLTVSKNAPQAKHPRTKLVTRTLIRRVSLVATQLPTYLLAVLRMSMLTTRPMCVLRLAQQAGNIPLDEIASQSVLIQANGFSMPRTVSIRVQKVRHQMTKVASQQPSGFAKIALPTHLQIMPIIYVLLNVHQTR